MEKQINEYNWCFVYLGANQDAFAEARKYGIFFAADYAPNSAGTRAATSNMSKGVSRYRSGGSYKVN